MNRNQQKKILISNSTQLLLNFQFPTLNKYDTRLNRFYDAYKNNYLLFKF